MTPLNRTHFQARKTMGTEKPFTAVIKMAASNEREALVMYGTPHVPIIVPISSVDFEPMHDIDGSTYRITMDQQNAKELGFLG